MAASSIGTKWSAWAPQLLSVLRIVAAVMFMQAGTVKLFGWPMAMPDGVDRRRCCPRCGLGRCSSSWAAPC